MQLFIIITLYPHGDILGFGAEPLLVTIIGQDSIAMCQLAGKYLRILTIGLPGFILFENAKHFYKLKNFPCINFSIDYMCSIECIS